MKIRTGFVSNSSSSSFVIGIAKVKNEEGVLRIKEYIDENPILIGTALLATYEEILNKKPYGVNISKDSLSVESFNYSEVFLNTKNLQPTDYVLIIDGSGYHDEDDFIVCDEDGEFIEYDYDIDLEFPDYIEKLLGILYSPDCEFANSSTGAGRDG